MEPRGVQTHSQRVRRQGAGPGIVSLHANASSSAQWRGLIDTLPRVRVVAFVDAL